MTNADDLWRWTVAFLVLLDVQVLVVIVLLGIVIARLKRLPDRGPPL